MKAQTPSDPPAKESEIEVIGVDWIHNADSQPDFTLSAPPDELVTSLILVLCYSQDFTYHALF